jgi:hypothetical protein
MHSKIDKEELAIELETIGVGLPTNANKIGGVTAL